MKLNRDGKWIQVNTSKMDRSLKAKTRGGALSRGKTSMFAAISVTGDQIYLNGERLTVYHKSLAKGPYIQHFQIKNYM